MGHQTLKSVLSCLLLIALTGCAGGGLSRVASDAELPKDLPQEMAQKFEIREVSATTSLPVAPAVVQTSPDALDPTKVQSAAVSKATGAPVSHKKAQGKTSPKTSTRADAPSATDVTGADVNSDKTEEVFEFPSRRPKVDPVWIGEQHVFEITYFGMAAAEVAVDVLPYKELNGRKAYHIKGTATSSAVFSLFYKVNDTIESFMDYDGLFSHRFHLLLDESKQTRDALELYDSEKKQTYYWNRWNHWKKGFVESKEFKPMEPFSQDSLSALFYLRFVPLPNGAVVTFPVTSEGKGWEAVVTVIGREQIYTPMGRIRAIKVKPETRYEGVLRKNGDSFIWLSDDDRRFVLRLEAKVKIGTVIATLKDIKKGTPP